MGRKKRTIVEVVREVVLWKKLGAQGLGRGSMMGLRWRLLHTQHPDFVFVTPTPNLARDAGRPRKGTRQPRSAALAFPKNWKGKFSEGQWQ